MIAMNFCDYKWDLNVEVCPCDVHFNEWTEMQRLAGKTIYHFGTGMHHTVGIRQAENGSGNSVFAITAAKQEYDSYIELATQKPAVAKSYLVYFGDIYLSNPMLLPNVDIATMFHLCEFVQPNTNSPDYGGLTDRGLLDLITSKVRPGGHILFYMKSFAFDEAEVIVADWARTGEVERIGEYKTLLVYRRRG